MDCKNEGILMIFIYKVRSRWNFDILNFCRNKIYKISRIAQLVTDVKIYLRSIPMNPVQNYGHVKQVFTKKTQF